MIKDHNMKKDYIALGRELKAKGEFEKAIREFEKAIEYHQEIYTAYFEKGRCLTKLERDDEALKCFETAIRIDKRRNQAYYGAGIVYFRKECFEAARGYFEQSTRCYKESVTAWYWLGQTLMELHQEERALKAFQNALSSAVKYHPEMVEKINEKITAASEYKSKLEKRIEELEKRIEELEAKNKALRKKLSERKEIVVNGDVVGPGANLIKGDAVVNRPNLAKGVKPATHSAVCPECGSPVEEGDMFCRKCGRKLT